MAVARPSRRPTGPRGPWACFRACRSRRRKPGSPTSPSRRRSRRLRPGGSTASRPGACVCAAVRARSAGRRLDRHHGAAHLFDGKHRLLADIAGRLARRGIAARAAIADTPGAAWAVARYAAAPETVVAVGEVRAAISPLPIAALRLPDDTSDGLALLGFERI